MFGFPRWLSAVLFVGMAVHRLSYRGCRWAVLFLVRATSDWCTTEVVGRVGSVAGIEATGVPPMELGGPGRALESKRLE